MNTDKHRSAEPQPKNLTAETQRPQRKECRNRSSPRTPRLRGEKKLRKILEDGRLLSRGAEPGVRGTISIDDVETQCEDYSCCHINPPIQAAQREFVKARPEKKKALL